MTFVAGELYTFEMARAIRKMPKPFPFTMDVGETDTQINLLVYGSEVKPLNDADRFKVMKYLNEVALMLETFGVKVNIEGVPGEPRRL